MKLKVFHSKDGDCLLLTSGDGRHALIDGGRTESFREQTWKSLRDLEKAGQPIDLVVVSHIDADHISGILWLMKAVAAWAVFDFQRGAGGNPNFPAPAVERPPTIKKIWHNSWRAQLGDLAGEIEALAVRTRAALEVIRPDPSTASPVAVLALDAVRNLAESIPEGVELRRIIDDDTPIPRNKPFKELVILKTPPHVERLGTTRLTVIGPAKKHLETLREDWRRWLADKPGGGQGVDTALRADLGTSVVGDDLSQALAVERALGGRLLAAITAGAEIIVKSDPSRVTPPNRASITLLAEEKKRTCLLTGDAAEEEILEGLKAAGRIVDGRFSCNVLKVQHHGSEFNLSQRFAGTVLAENYVFCADGAHHNPDPSVVKTIVETRLDADPRPFTVWFNCSPERTLPSRKSALAAAITEARVPAGRGRITVKVLNKGPFFDIPV